MYIQYFTDLVVHSKTGLSFCCLIFILHQWWDLLHNMSQSHATIYTCHPDMKWHHERMLTGQWSQTFQLGHITRHAVWHVSNDRHVKTQPNRTRYKHWPWTKVTRPRDGNVDGVGACHATTELVGRWLILLMTTAKSQHMWLNHSQNDNH